ncbi:EAL domain-containing protein [Acetobacter oeni]|uniref:EAL domain-containing protein n=1 Tax=Acetobacter oeni TaxID=304077 RepID=UPI0011BDA2BE|nr:EAL domain-containing protein [Acetobacter oeni]MBB3883357.1 EAL domain-containing protein (putative c-di-GMP-specific phosphodiesterase class I) [Acetobacter oeni]NHO19475.1 EAL domain-containing protein [Acetobacter oeni]
MTTAPVSADPPKRRAPRAAPLRTEDRGSAAASLAPRFVLSTLTLAGADFLSEPTMAPGRNIRRRPREPAWAVTLAQGCAVAATLPKHCRLSLPIDYPEAIPDDLILRLTQVLSQTDVSIERLDLEFGESSLAADTNTLCYSLAALRDAGVGLILSGLGTGTTSLTLLRDRVLAGLLTGIKLDRHLLLRDPAHIEAGHVLTRTIVQLGSDFGLVTRAEGIDSQETLAFLREIGCQEGRGSLLGKPQPAPQFISSHFQSGSSRARS